MTSSSAGILTTHVGSLPRPQDVVDCLFAQDRGEPYEASRFEDVMRGAVADVVRRQLTVGIDVVGDGEMSKISYATYIRHRLNGFEVGNVPRATPQDLDDYPEYRDRIAAAGATPKYVRPICKGPISVKTLEPLRADIARLKASLAGGHQGFMTAVSPGTIAVFQPNEYYPSHAAYLQALAEAMRVEYETIAQSGLLLSIDCPDLGMGRHIRFRDVDDDEFVRNAALQIEALNAALVNVPAERTRLHICWGNYEGPHTRDIPLSKVLPVLLTAKPAQLLIEAANPRHEHEWALWEQHKLPDDKVLVPGVLDTSCNFVEHPELVAQRLMRYVNLVGRERVIAGTDCGFGTFAGFGAVHPAICWVKMQSLVEGARLATRRLWNRH
ncbi:MAG TPA: cobalamin-independent methionine synthase II family protein [Steroidobacteraceae bacterium]|nr:cobalamin-independent methionine synthase II family protein [Steroidobacteraceae bacterium]